MTLKHKRLHTLGACIVVEEPVNPATCSPESEQSSTIEVYDYA